MSGASEYTRVPCELVASPWCRMNHGTPALDCVSVEVFDGRNVAVATVELVVRTDNAAERAAWLLWRDGETRRPEYSEWVVLNGLRPFDTRREDGVATDVLIAYVVPALADYLREVSPHVMPPDAPTLRRLFEAALQARAQSAGAAPPAS